MSRLKNWWLSILDNHPSAVTSSAVAIAVFAVTHSCLGIKIAYQQNELIRLSKQNTELLERLNEQADWYSIKRFNREFRAELDKCGRDVLSRNDVKSIKELSAKYGYAIKKADDADYGQVNLYHINVLQAYLNCKYIDVRITSKACQSQSVLAE